MNDLEPLRYTYVLYNSSDSVAYFLSYWSLLPIFVMVTYAAWFFTRRDIEPAIIAGGQVVNDIINSIIKRLIKQERPIYATLDRGYGMPSAHAQFMGFCATYLTLKILYHWYPTAKFTNNIKNDNKNNQFEFLEKSFWIFILYLGALMVCLSRIYLHYHTCFQVSIGFLLGIFSASCFFIIIGLFRIYGIVDLVVNSPCGKFFYIRDDYYGGKSFKEEYDEWIMRRKLEKNK